MKTLHVIQAYHKNEEIETEDYRVTRIAYKGFSRGYGEFMELTSHLAEGKWIAFQPHDVGLSYEELLNACKNAPTNLFQIAVADESDTVWKFLKKNNKTGWHEVDFVEVMTPVFKKEFFDICKPTFSESKSSYGLDFLWARMHINHYGKKPSVCYDYTMTHPGPVTSGKWLIDGKKPSQELKAIKRKYNI